MPLNKEEEVLPIPEGGLDSALVMLGSLSTQKLSEEDLGNMDGGVMDREIVAEEEWDEEVLKKVAKQI